MLLHLQDTMSFTDRNNGRNTVIGAFITMSFLVLQGILQTIECIHALVDAHVVEQTVSLTSALQTIASTMIYFRLSSSKRHNDGSLSHATRLFCLCATQKGLVNILQGTICKKASVSIGIGLEAVSSIGSAIYVLPHLFNMLMLLAETVPTNYELAFGRMKREISTMEGILHLQDAHMWRHRNGSIHVTMSLIVRADANRSLIRSSISEKLPYASAVIIELESDSIQKLFS